LGPEGKEFYSTQRSKYDTVEFVAETTGEYQLCFSNEFSSLSHKTVYFEFVIGDEPPLTKDIGDHQVALTLLETSVTKIHEALRVIDNYQKHHRVREAQGKSAANHLNLRVQYWSIGEAVLFVVIALLEVFILRQFFATKRTTI
jgi:protein ERP2